MITSVKKRKIGGVRRYLHFVYIFRFWTPLHFLREILLSKARVSENDAGVSRARRSRTGTLLEKLTPLAKNYMFDHYNKSNAFFSLTCRVEIICRSFLLFQDGLQTNSNSCPSTPYKGYVYTSEHYGPPSLENGHESLGRIRLRFKSFQLYFGY